MDSSYSYCSRPSSSGDGGGGGSIVGGGVGGVGVFINIITSFSFAPILSIY